jgi:hypothetical protein
MRRLPLATTAFLCAALSVCVAAQSQQPAARGSRPTEWDVWDPADSTGDILVPVRGIPGLTQHLRILPRAPRQGDTVYIASRLEYSGRDSVRLTTHICGYSLRAEGDWLRFVSGDVCQGYAQTRWWSAGANDLNGAVFLVTGQPGTHRALVTDLLDPVFAAPLDVTVRPRARSPDE